MDVVRVGKVEADLNGLEVPRVGGQGRDKANALQEAWEASERAYIEKRQRALREQWRAWHLDMADGLLRTAASLAREHRARAATLLEEPGDGLETPKGLSTQKGEIK